MYISYEEFQKREIKRASNLSKEYIEDRLLALSNIVDEYCNTRFIPTQYFYKCNANEKILLPKRPLLNVVELSINNILLNEDDTFFIDLNKSIVEIDNYMQYEYKKRNTVINYHYGYEKVPEIVKDVIVELFLLELDSKDLKDGIKQESWEEYSYTRDDDKLSKEDILKRLDRFIEDKNEKLEDKPYASINAYLL